MYRIKSIKRLSRNLTGKIICNNYFVVQKRFLLFFWIKLLHKDFDYLERAEKALTAHLVSLKNEALEKEAAKQNEIYKYYVMKNDKLLCGDSAKEVKKISNLTAFL